MSDRPARAPFARLRPAVALAAAYAAASLLWVVAGDVLPGSRWLAVHLFTLGTLTNLVAALSGHFAETLLHVRPPRGALVRLALLNVGTLAVLVAIPTNRTWLVASGATVVSVAVFWLYLSLRRMRKDSLGGRFAFVVRSYERASGAFLHAALLGALLGAGVLPGAWYVSGRLAHFHVGVLGWGGVTLLATLVFFGPTVMRTRMEDGADAAASRWLGHASTGLTIATFALLGTGMGGTAATVLRLVAAAGLGVYAWAATAVCVPVLRAGRRARPSPHGRMLLAATGWFLVGAWMAAALAAAGGGRWYDSVGVVVVVGVLAQAILAASAYLSPMVWPRGVPRRSNARSALERLPTLRPATFNAGVALIGVAAVVGRAAGTAGAVALRAGWLLVLATLLAQAALTVRGTLRPEASA